ncbi:MAG TPA: carboxypeptidase-like regulatory domain-containing protein [Burkholderiales bacterium]|nr:carboxypeptidase-like regulatory domain-containing protein [Burkholderiales bacterium]
MLRIIMAVALVALLLSACGGGGGGDGPPPSASFATFSGTVAIGAPLAGVTVLVVHVDGSGASAVTDATGRYSVTLTGVPPGARPLFIIQTRDPVAGILSQPPAYPRLYSISNRTTGTVNLTPLTSLLVAQLLGETQIFVADLALLQSLPTPSDGEIAAARQQVVDYLLLRPNRNGATFPPTPVDASLVADSIRTPFNAVTGDPHDDAIESLAQTFMEGESIEGVEEHMLARNDPPATLLEILSLEANVNCVAEGNPDPTLPVGPVHVSLRSTGEIIIGSYTYTLVPGVDRVRKSNSPFFDDFWQFLLNGSGTGDQLEIGENASMLGSVRILRPGSGTSCSPTTNVPLGPRSPSRLAQVRRLASAIAITSLAVNCPGGSSFPGLSDGVNAIGIESNGALRVGGIGGYALHLPSLGLDMSADIIGSPGVLGTRVISAGFSRIFMGGFDSFTVSLDALGDIQTTSFGQRRNNGPSLSQTCT